MLSYENGIWRERIAREEFRGTNEFLIKLSGPQQGIPQLVQYNVMGRFELPSVLDQLIAENPASLLRAYTGLNPNCCQFLNMQIELLNNYHMQSYTRTKSSIREAPCPLLLEQPELLAQQFDRWVIEPSELRR